mmetsp:Transcript_51710/g.93177  ORF Transcript_51710/g.93177 Transcript_51710/m.93177 type:complete len:215 (-) Transcript_51710:60-704(-)
MRFFRRLLVLLSALALSLLQGQPLAWVELGRLVASRLSLGLFASAQRGGGISMRAVAEPPTRTRPPEVDSDTSVRSAEWTECLINDPTGSSDRVETWVFRTTDYTFFLRLLKLRGFQNQGQKATLNCRERHVDAEVPCAECVRLLQGGFYGNLGVAVPAYPPQPEAVGCMALSKLIDMPSPSTEEDDSGDWDGDQGRQTAFCNSVNARFERVDA